MSNYLPTPTPQDAEYITQVAAAWDEAVELADSTEGWKEEKSDKKTVKCCVCRAMRCRPWYSTVQYSTVQYSTVQPAMHFC